MDTVKDMNIPEAEAVQMVKEAGLRYVKDSIPGYTRKRYGEKYQYFKPDGTLIEEEKTIARINQLAIPPIWEEVWICPNEKGHLQATGMDKKKRNNTGTIKNGID